MSSDPYASRRGISFAQAEGIEELPRQLALHEISQELRARLWELVYSSMLLHRQVSASGRRYIIVSPWRNILYRKHVHRDHEMADEFDVGFDNVVAQLKSIFLFKDYVAVFDLVQWMLSQPDFPIASRAIAGALEDSRAAYRLLDDGRTIVPISNSHDALVVNRAIADLSSGSFDGALVHLQAAARHLTSGATSDCVRESVHAVESIARALGGANSLAGALQTLKKSHGLHPALERGFNSIYGYTSDEEGIRHPLIDDGVAKVDETDAMFMLGACSSFVSYLINRARQVSQRGAAA